MVRTRAAWAAAALLTATLAATAVPAHAAPSTAAPSTAAPAAAAAACPTGWGSVDKTYTAGTSTPVRNARSGQQDCYDRLVVDVPGAGAAELGYSVRYVDRLYADGSGRYIPVGGGAILEIRVAAPAYDPETGAPTYPARTAQPLPGVNVTGYRTFRDTRYAVSFEGITQMGLGVRARLPFRVLRLDDRLVIDVAHSWTAAR